MPKFQNPRIIPCPVRDDGSSEARHWVYMDPRMLIPGAPGKDRDLVEEFLTSVGNKAWREEELSDEERNYYGVPDGAKVVSFPEQHHAVFYQEYERFMEPYHILIENAELARWPVVNWQSPTP